MSGLPDNLRGGIATVMFQLPVVRHNYAWAGCMPAGTPAPRPASRAIAVAVKHAMPGSRGLIAWHPLADLKLMLQHLRSPGGSISVMPEGIAGPQAISHRRSKVLLLRSCRLCRIASVCAHNVFIHAWAHLQFQPVSMQVLRRKRLTRQRGLQWRCARAG